MTNTQLFFVNIAVFTPLIVGYGLWAFSLGLKMARSTYIYLVRTKACGTVLASFTVKSEAHDWAAHHSGCPLNCLQLSRMRDGIEGNKNEILIPWEDV